MQFKTLCFRHKVFQTYVAQERSDFGALMSKKPLKEKKVPINDIFSVTKASAMI